MNEDKLSNIENNLALLVGLTQVQVKVQESLADQYEKLIEVSENFRAAAGVWKQSAIDTENAVELQMAGLDIFDHEGKVRSFLEHNELFTMWEKKDE